MTKRITIDEINMLYEKWETPEHVKAHCRAVSDVALKMAEELNKNGYNLDLELIRGAGLAHDVARVHEYHDEIGYSILAGLGYMDEALIVKTHMNYPAYSQLDELNECDMICLADRIVIEDKYVGLEDRIQYVINKAQAVGERRERIYNNMSKGKIVIDHIEKCIGKTLDELFGV